MSDDLENKGYTDLTVYPCDQDQAEDVWQMYVDANEARIDAEAKLVKAMEALEKVQTFKQALYPFADVPSLLDACDILKELKGQDDVRSE